jgi:exodeoxyribonuclease-5
MTQIKAPESAITDRATGRFYCPIFDAKPTGHEAARDREKAELDRERIRLWYVAATRARELLVLPRLDIAAKRSAWISLLDLSLAKLPALDLNHLPPEIGSNSPGVQNVQTREVFAAEAQVTAECRPYRVQDAFRIIAVKDR